jgi:hypothetical protein
VPLSARAFTARYASCEGQPTSPTGIDIGGLSHTISMQTLLPPLSARGSRCCRPTVAPMSHLDHRVVAAWAATSWLHEPGPPASPSDVQFVEQAVGRTLPQAVRDLYQRHDGGTWVGGDLSLMPLLSGGDVSVARASAAHRRWGWPVPDEVVIFGSDGGGDPLGLWLPDAAARPVVVKIGAIFAPGSMGIVGEDLNAFLRAWTAYHLLLPHREAVTAGLDALELPDRLRSDDPDDETLAQIFEWASPTIMVSKSDPYEAELTAEDVRRIAEDG